MSKVEGDGHSHTTSNDIRGGDMVTDKPPETEARSGPKEHGESNAEHHERDKIRNEVVRSRTKVRDVIERAQYTKGQWAGHLARMKNIEWAKRTMEWQPREGRRAKGRPKRR